MPRMKVVQVSKPGRDLEVVERDIPEPTCAAGAHQGAGVRRVPQRHVHRRRRISRHPVSPRARSRGGRRHRCRRRGRAGLEEGHARRRGLARRSLRALRVVPPRRLHYLQGGQIPGISYDGGYAEYMIAPFEALASIPEELKSEDAAPLLCAGITTFNALRHSGARARAISSRSSGSADWVTSACSSPPRWDSGPSRSHAARTRVRWPKSSARTSISTAPRRMRPRS